MKTSEHDFRIAKIVVNAQNFANTYDRNLRFLTKISTLENLAELGIELNNNWDNATEFMRKWVKTKSGKLALHEYRQHIEKELENDRKNEDEAYQMGLDFAYFGITPTKKFERGSILEQKFNEGLYYGKEAKEEDKNSDKA